MIFPTCKTCLIFSATVLLVCAALFCVDNGFTTAGMIEALGGMKVENANSFVGGSGDARRGLNSSGLNVGEAHASSGAGRGEATPGSTAIARASEAFTVTTMQYQG